jgi:hypothetical protein
MDPSQPRLVIESIDDRRNPAFRAALGLYERVFPNTELRAAPATV